MQKILILEDFDSPVYGPLRAGEERAVTESAAAVKDLSAEALQDLSAGALAKADAEAFIRDGRAHECDKPPAKAKK